jgi:tetratricopeptide (TPR) repeat protein
MCLLAVGAGGLEAQFAEGFPLEEGTRQELVELQEMWIDWLAQIHQDDLNGATATVDNILAATRELGMRGLPDLATGASVQAVAFSGEGEFEKARAALLAAERFQPGEPETALAEMTVARTQGRWIAAGGWLVKAGVRLLAAQSARRVILANLYHWILVVFTLGAFSFVGLEMVARGDLLVRDISDFIGRSLPSPAALALTALLLVWPLVLPSGLLWLALYWSVLLWGYGSIGVRVVMVALWLFLGSMPLLVTEQVRRLDLDMSAPVQAMESIATGRLEGSVFSDLGVLVELLPDSTAVKHFQADLHLQLRQWEAARNLYREVLEAEGERSDLLADLGAVYLYERDLDNAIQRLQQAAAAPDAPPEVYFNLSRALSEQYRFSESEAMLRRASTLDRRAVGEWIVSMESNRVVRTAGGFARRAEIRNEIEEVWTHDDSNASLAGVWRRTLSLPLALVLAGPAVGVFFLARKTRRRNRRESEPWFKGWPETIRRAILPGLPEAEGGRIGGTWLALVVALGLFSLPFSAGFSFSLLLGYAPGLPSFWILSAVGLVAFFLLRLFIYKSHRPRGG